MQQVRREGKCILISGKNIWMKKGHLQNQTEYGDNVKIDHKEILV
jgi:hypothetical protein